MKKYVFGILSAATLSALVASFVFAQEPRIRDDIPDEYTVVKGDTLWDISGTFLQNPWMWPEIWHVNTQIANPHLIYPGDKVRLVYFQGKPRLEIDRSGRVFKLSPKARILTPDEAIETIPLDRIDSFLSRSRVVSDEELKKAPYVITGGDNHLLVAEGGKAYVRGDVDDVFSRYGVYRRGETYIDPITKEFLGVQAMDIASGEIRAIDGEVSTLLITRTAEEVRAGDRLLEHEERAVTSTFYPSPPKGDVNAVILDVEGGVSQVGKLDVVVINRGERESMEAGNVLAIYKRGQRVRDRVTGDMVRLPDERAGLMMIFRVFEKVSFGLILEADKGVKVNDLVKNPE